MLVKLYLKWNNTGIPILECYVYFEEVFVARQKKGFSHRLSQDFIPYHVISLMLSGMEYDTFPFHYSY